MVFDCSNASLILALACERLGSVADVYDVTNPRRCHRKTQENMHEFINSVETKESNNIAIQQATEMARSRYRFRYSTLSTLVWDLGIWPVLGQRYSSKTIIPRSNTHMCHLLRNIKSYSKLYMRHAIYTYP